MRLRCLTQSSRWVLNTLKNMFVLTCMMQWDGSVGHSWGGCNQASGFQGQCQCNVSSPPLFSQVSLYWLKGPCWCDRPSHTIKACSLPQLSLYKWKSEQEIWHTHPCHMSLAIHPHYSWAVEGGKETQKAPAKNSLTVKLTFLKSFFLIALNKC